MTALFASLFSSAAGYIAAAFAGLLALAGIVLTARAGGKDAQRATDAKQQQQQVHDASKAVDQNTRLDDSSVQRELHRQYDRK